MENAKSDFIVMPCNTLHQLIPQIRRYTNLDVLDLIEEVSHYINENHKKIGILSTNKTKKERLYDLNLQGVEIIYPSEEQQNHISEIIIRIIRQNSTKRDLIYLNNIIKDMTKNGA